MKNKLSSGYIYIYIYIERERERERERVIQHHHQQRSKLRSRCQIGKLSSEMIKKRGHFKVDDCIKETMSRYGLFCHWVRTLSTKMIFESNLKGIKWTLTKKEIKGVRIFSMLAKLWVKI